VTENEEENREMNNPFPHILEFIRIRIRWGILDVPRKIVRWFKNLGWKITFGFMNSSVKRSMDNLKSLKKHFEFRNWMFKQIIKYMTENQGWVLTVVHPRAEHLKKRWVQMAFVNPQFLNVETVIEEDGTKVVKNIELLPRQELLVQEWHITNLEHILRQEKCNLEVEE